MLRQLKHCLIQMMLRLVLHLGIAKHRQLTKQKARKEKVHHIYEKIQKVTRAKYVLPLSLKSDNSEIGETGEMSGTWRNVQNQVKCLKIVKPKPGEIPKSNIRKFIRKTTGA
ncbi:hypothetical protein C2G38_2138458 [Gigaspora rosea]|uniref:Uncharacterized protein n=1 Tax=Gigaspora rosea TaxID=44941 RepID=A0A397VWI0_9GLOM|nr:hypothetical protein C2G38_2138458 [Gigaspora rosea]